MTTATENILIPEPGIYADVPASIYHSWDYASKSRLDTIAARSGAHLRHRILHPESTPALVFGSLLHTMVLEPEHFSAEFAIRPQCDRRTKEGKAVYAEFESMLGRRTEIVESDADAACEMNKAINRHPAAAAILAGRSGVEVSGVWDEEGTRCKLRADLLCEGQGIIADIKTTEDASPAGFQRSLCTYRYHVQAAMYLHGMAALGKTFEHFVLIVVEKSPPYGVGVYRLDDEAVAVGRRTMLADLKAYAKAEAAGWPCYSERIETITLPRWGWNEPEGD